ncbi:hypothetical protein OH76DRAFT_1140043 [Lentinus brumalis]|uniref:Uncharacterized protein n=1 Tax=Lentinus brumalis TaxID=2498619 RepID=A0A371DM98_9APHY|nr:hypothetical protein OH76DRAFT_1140043 [Polyporus brumalis]
MQGRTNTGLTTGRVSPAYVASRVSLTSNRRILVWKYGSPTHQAFPVSMAQECRRIQNIPCRPAPFVWLSGSRGLSFAPFVASRILKFLSPTSEGKTRQVHIDKAVEEANRRLTLRPALAGTAVPGPLSRPTTRGQVDRLLVLDSLDGFSLDLTLRVAILADS